MNIANTSSTLTQNWMGGYASPAGYFDEFIDGKGEPRAHWKGISNQLGAIPQDDWQRRERQLSRLIHDNGITYNVYGQDESDLRPWGLDMLPLVIPQEEVEKLESALSQRAHLLNLVLQDVYGRQTMLNSGKMNPYLVFANPSFLRPCHGLLAPRARHVHLYAADLTRSPDGNWWVLSDRVEAASGLGYALENRMLMSRIFPQVMGEAEVQALNPFIQAFCRYVESLSPGQGDNPNVALLTAGPKNETYFEQSFLARNLGYTLAEGEDLTVRNNRLYMKTITGVQPIDVLLRRVDAPWMDPLELKKESLLGVPGLLNTIRQGHLSVANALGSGFVETPAMLAFLQWFSRYYMGENLEMPSVATWWCGQKTECKFVLENIERLAIKPTFMTPGSRSYFGPLMSSSERSELIARIKAQPEMYCGQEIVSNATIPIYENGRMSSRHFQLRVFLVPTDEGWKMMPGGLVRYAPSEGNLKVSMQSGGQSKDTWVIRSETGTEKVKPKQAVEKVNVRRSSNDLPSRTANNLFWLGRYIERAESQARLLRTLCNLLIDEIGSEDQLAGLPFLDQVIPFGSDLNALVDGGLLDFGKVEKLILKAIYDLNDPESLLTNVNEIVRTAGKVKERLSVDTWKRLEGLRDVAELKKGRSDSIFDEETLILLDTALDELSSFVGNVSENMIRSQGWLFLQIGRRAERGLAISALLDSAYQVVNISDETMLSRLLEWADSSITYRRRYLNTLLPSSVLDLLCFDSSNPRSLAYQAESIREYLSQLPHAQMNTRHVIDQISLRIYSRIGLMDPSGFLDGEAKDRRARVDAFFKETSRDFMQLCDSMAQHYFAHTARAEEVKPQTLIG